MRIGHGYDVHKLSSVGLLLNNGSRALILGGVKIPYETYLLGHSDADVLYHAVADAILGAAALGDIGTIFPDNDPKTEGMDSAIIVTKAAELIHGLGLAVVNLDCTIIAEAPKLRPYIDEMRLNLSRLLGAEPGAVSVKATTEEGLGFTGAKQGIAAHAVVLLE